MRRPLGETERAIWLLDRAGSLNGAFCARVAGPLDPDLLRRALDRVQAACPLLRVRVEASDPPAFTSSGVPPIPLRALELRGEGHWLAELEDELNRPFAWHEGPLARVTLLRGERCAELLVAYHHMIADGASGPYLVRDILRTAADLFEGKPSPGPLPAPERPPLEALLPASARGVAALRSVALAGARGLFTALRRPAKLAVERAAPPLLRRSRVVHHGLEAPESSALARRCRERGVTIHGALAAAVLQGVAGALPAAGKEPRLLVCSSPVNLRPHLQPRIGDEVGLFISAVLTALPVRAEDDPWALARRAKAEMTAAVERGEPLAAVHLQSLLRALTATPARFSWAAEELFTGAVAVANLGRLDVPEAYGPFRLEAVEGGVAVNVISGTCLALCARSFAGRLSLTFVGAEPLLSRARTEELASRVVARLRSMI
jgi:NRPS condensation-like uncharacterized protein